jgi:hypothetical protein
MKTIQDYLFLFDREKDTTKYQTLKTQKIIETTNLANGSVMVRSLEPVIGWLDHGEMSQTQFLAWVDKHHG